MRRVQKRAAAAGGDLLDGRAAHRRRCRFLVAAVVVQIASQIDLHVDAMASEHFFAQKDQIRLVEHAPGNCARSRLGKHVAEVKLEQNEQREQTGRART